MVDKTNEQGNNDYEDESPDNMTNDNTMEEAQPRRSSRTSKKLSYLDDYILLAEVEGERLLLLLNEEPWSYDEAMEDKVWRDACQYEMESIVKIIHGILLTCLRVLKQ